MLEDRPHVFDDGTWRELRSRLVRFVRSRIHHDQDAEDIVHDALVKGLTRISDIRDVQSVQSWFFQITMNAIRDHYRRKRPHEEFDEEMAAEEPTSAEQHELAECVASMVRLLEEPYRSAVIGSELNGTPLRVLAEDVGISVSGMKSRVQRGRQRLRDLIESCCRIELDSTGAPRTEGMHCTSDTCDPTQTC